MQHSSFSRLCTTSERDWRAVPKTPSRDPSEHVSTRRQRALGDCKTRTAATLRPNRAPAVQDRRDERQSPPPPPPSPPDKSGPITGNLESVLNNNKICVQAYRSESFVGNQCHKYLEPQVFTQICDNIVPKAKELNWLGGSQLSGRNLSVIHFKPSTACFRMFIVVYHTKCSYHQQK